MLPHKIFKAMKIRKRHVSKQRSSIFAKLFLISLFLNGILIHGNKLVQFLMASFYHIAWALSLTKSITCIITNIYLVDLYSANVIAHLLAISLWWILFIRRNQIHKFILRLSFKQQVSLKLARRLLVMLLALILFPPFFLYIDMASRAVNDEDGRLGPRPCLFFKDLTDSHLKNFFHTVETIRPYISYSVFFNGFISFAICGFLAWKSLQSTADRLYLENDFDIWDRLKNAVLTVKKLEAILSLPIFFLMCKISVEIFNGVSALCSGKRAEYAQFVFILAVPQQTVWFLTIVTLGDLIQKQCLKIINISFSRLKNSETVSIDLSYLDYKTMKAATIVTAGGVFRVNRGLLLKALTSAITYAVIISQFKENN